MKRVFSNAKLFLSGVSSEQIKLKRSFAIRLVFIFPLFSVFGSLLLYGQIPWQGSAFMSWRNLSEFVLVFFATIMPLLIAIESGLISGIEHSSEGWKHLFTQPVPKWSVYFSKLAILHLLIFVAMIIALLCVPFAGALKGLPLYKSKWMIDLLIFQNFKTILTFYFGSWFVISIHLLMSWYWKSFILSFVIGIAATFDGILTMTVKASMYHPWIIAPIDNDVDPVFALVFRITGGIILAALSCWILSRRDVK